MSDFARRADDFILRHECIANHKMVDALKEKIENIDKRMWTILIGISINLIGVVATLAILFVQKPN